MGVSHYSDIYTFDSSRVRWDESKKCWVHYEGYGRDCKEKTDFTESVNLDHDLWGTPVPGRWATEIVPSPEKCDPNRVQFLGPVNTRIFQVVLDRVDGIPDEYQHDTTFAIERSDGKYRSSANFQQMLADYAEKAVNRELKEGFFDVGGMGRKWSENADLMGYFTRRFLEIDGLLNDDKEWRISLPSQAVRNYPLREYLSAREGFFSRNRFSNLRATAPEFYPGPSLCDAPPPEGAPPPRRPSASTKNSTCHLTWEQKKEQERNYAELSNKLDKIIALQR